MLNYSEVCEKLTDAGQMTPDQCPQYEIVPEKGINDIDGIKPKVEKNY